MQHVLKSTGRRRATLPVLNYSVIRHSDTFYLDPVKIFYLIYCQFPFFKNFFFFFLVSVWTVFFFVQVTYDMIEGMLNGALTLCLCARVMVCSHSAKGERCRSKLVHFILYKPRRLFTRMKDENDSDIVACALLLNRCCKPMLERRRYIAVTCVNRT